MYFVYFDAVAAVAAVAVVVVVDVVAVAVVTNWKKNLLQPFAQLWMSGKACSE